MKTISETLRATMQRSGQSRYRISQETGIAESALGKFAAGGGLHIETVDRLAAHFALELVPKRKQRRGVR